MTTDIFCFYLQKRLIQTSQTGGQLYSDTSPFSIPCPLNALNICKFQHFFKKDILIEKKLSPGGFQNFPFDEIKFFFFIYCCHCEYAGVVIEP